MPKHPARRVCAKRLCGGRHERKKVHPRPARPAVQGHQRQLQPRPYRRLARSRARLWAGRCDALPTLALATRGSGPQRQAGRCRWSRALHPGVALVLDRVPSGAQAQAPGRVSDPVPGLVRGQAQVLAPAQAREIPATPDSTLAGLHWAIRNLAARQVLARVSLPARTQARAQAQEGNLWPRPHRSPGYRQPQEPRGQQAPPGRRWPHRHLAHPAPPPARAAAAQAPRMALVCCLVAHPAPGSALALRTAAQALLWRHTPRRMAVAPPHTKREPQAPGMATQPKRQE